jgi:hypothetical protein
VIDEADASADGAGVRTIVARTLMKDRATRRALAETVLACAS